MRRRLFLRIYRRLRDGLVIINEVAREDFTQKEFNGD
jgi:hypothetical protein